MEDVAELYGVGRARAVTAFGRGRCYVEQFLDRPRHVEAQVLADQHNNVVIGWARAIARLRAAAKKLVKPRWLATTSVSASMRPRATSARTPVMSAWHRGIPA